MLEKTLSKIEKRFESLPEEARCELEPLLRELRGEIGHLREENSDNADSIVGFAGVAAHEITRKDRDDSLLDHALGGFRDSARELESSHPNLVNVVNRICDALSGIGV